MTRGRRSLASLRSDTSGVALLEFALVLPILLTMALAGAEITNYIIIKMRISQIALQIADNAARMGQGTMLQNKTVYESDITDVFAGANLQARELQLQTRGRVILSSLESMSSPSTAYQIRWQRCYGNQAHASTYGNAGSTNLTGMGPAGRQVVAQGSNPTMFVEVYYVYKPLIWTKWIPSDTMTQIASMAVRDRRDTSAGTNGVAAGGTVSSC